VPDVQPGREEELRRLRRWLAFSERLDGLIEAAETRPARKPAPVPEAVRRHVGVRARLAVRLVRLARALHPEAAVGAVRQSQAETSASG